MNNDYKFKTKPYKHQHDCFMRNRRNKFYAFLNDMGTGKTKSALDVAAYMYDQGWINAMLIFGNKGSYLNWVDEIKIHLPNHINYKLAIWKANASIKEKKAIKDLFLCKEFCLKIFIVNIEALSYDRSSKIILKFVQGYGNETLSIIDESTTIKNPKSNRTKTAWKIGKYSKVRRILTGSPVDNNPLDIWAQFEFLKPGVLGHTSFYSFKCEYAILQEMKIRQKGVFRQFKTVVGYRNLEKLQQIIEKFSFIIRKEDCLDLPPKVYQQYSVDLTDEQKQHYKSLKENAFTAFEDEIITTKIALTLILRLQQLLCGHLTDDNGQAHKVKHNRLDVLSDIIDEASGKIIIWTNQRFCIKEIYEFLSKKYGADTVLTYYGDTKDKERALAKKVMKRGCKSKVRFLIGNPQTGGYGLNLTAANTVIYYNNSYDNELRRQSEDRAHRIGQVKKVTYIDIIAKGTVDEVILKALKTKTNLARAITPSNWKNFLK